MSAETVAGALHKAEGLYKTGELIVVTGSFYTIGEAKEACGHKGVLSGLRNDQNCSDPGPHLPKAAVKSICSVMHVPGFFTLCCLSSVFP